MDNCPVFRDNVRAQLVVDLAAIPGSPLTDVLLLRSHTTQEHSQQSRCSTFLLFRHNFPCKPEKSAVASLSVRRSASLDVGAIVCWSCGRLV